MSFYPFIRSCFTDWGAYMMNAQGDELPLCKSLEMKLMDCLEAHGLDKGRIVCRDLADDFAECMLRWKQVRRVEAMRIERHKQYLQGKRDQHYLPGPPVDSS